MTLVNRFFFSKETRAKRVIHRFLEPPLRVFLNIFILFFGMREVNKINIFQAQL